MSRRTIFAAALIPGIVTAVPAAGQVVDTAAAAVGLVEFEEACGRAHALWPAPLCGAVVLVDPATRVAVANRPDRAGLFMARHGAYVGEWPEGMPVANTALEWDDEQWAMVMLPLPSEPFSRLQLLAHESFHRIQPELGHTVADPMATHLDEEDGRVWLRLELRALARALAAEDGEAARIATGDALLFRAVRNHQFPGSAPIESQLEAHEGLAEYTGVRFALDATGEGVGRAARLVSRFENRPTYVRSLGYGTGPALGLLLDRFDPGWRHRLGEEPDLAGLLADVLGDPSQGLAPDVREGLALGRSALYEGRLAALGSASRSVARVAAPEQHHPDPQGVIHGPGWVLQLEPGWVLAPGSRPGDFRLVPTTP